MTNKRLSWMWLFGVLIAALAIIASFYFDEVVRDWILAHRTPALHKVMRRISRYGDWPGHVALGVVLALLAYLRGSKRWLRVFLAMLAACAIAGVAARVVKVSAGRERPAAAEEQEWNGPSLVNNHHSFPSGHTASSTAFFAVLALACWRLAGFLAVPLVIGFSRVCIGSHHLSDVVCAAVLGALCAWLVAFLLWRTLEDRALKIQDAA